VLFEYRLSRAGQWPKMLLSGFKGYLQTDGYEGYNQLLDEKPKTKQVSQASPREIIHLACWAHARRKFEHALSNDKARSTIALELIKDLYKINLHDKKHKKGCEGCQNKLK